MTDFPALNRDFIQIPDMARLEPQQTITHAPRILLLYGSLRERSFSRFLTEEAALKMN